MNRALEKIVLLQDVFYPVGPLLAVNVVPQSFSQDRAESNRLFFIFDYFFYSKFSKKINNIKKPVFIFFICKFWKNIFYLFKSSSQEIRCMGQGNFPFLQTEFFFKNCFFQFFPVADYFSVFTDQYLLHYFVGFNKEEGEMRQNIIYFRPAAGQFDIHLFFINPVAIAASFQRNNRFKR